MIQHSASLVERVSSGAYQELVLRAPELAQQLQPGQAVLVRAGWGLDPYLRRTFYPVALDAETFSLRLPPSGDRGQAWLRLCPLGAAIDCLGPVGVGFRLPAGASRLLCLGEGDLAWALLPLVHLADAAHLTVTLATTAATARAACRAGRGAARAQGARGADARARPLRAAPPDLRLALAAWRGLPPLALAVRA